METVFAAWGKFVILPPGGRDKAGRSHGRFCGMLKAYDGDGGTILMLRLGAAASGRPSHVHDWPRCHNFSAFPRSIVTNDAADQPAKIKMR